MEFCWDSRTDVPLRAANSDASPSPSRATAEYDIYDPLRYLPRFKVIVCRDHGGVRDWSKHLRVFHGTDAARRKVLARKYERVEVLKPIDVPLPPPFGPPFEVLGEPLDAFLCEEEECGVISTSRTRIGQHCNKKHDWKSSKEAKEHWTSVKVQTFFFTSGLQRYFVVRSPCIAQPTQPPSVGVNQHAVDALSELKAAREKREETLVQAEESVARTDRTGWFNRNGWAEHLAGRNLAHLSSASGLPKREEKLLWQACKVTELAVEQSVAGLSTLAHETRRWLKSANREECDVRPIARLQNPESQRRYCGYMKRFVCYMLRIVVDMAAQDHERSDESNMSSDPESSSDDDATSCDEPTEDASVDALRDARALFPWQNDQKDRATALLSALEIEDEHTQIQSLLDLFDSFIFHSVGDRSYCSALVHFLAILGIDEESNRLRPAADFSYMLAGVVYCIRVLAVEILLPSAEREHQGDTERSRFIEKRRNYLADGSYSPMSTMISLLAYGKHIALNTGNAASTQWSRDMKVLRLHGKPIVLERFKDMIQDVLAEAERMIWEDVLYIGQHDRFLIPLDEIEDDVTFTKRGFSFVNRPNGHLGDGIDWTIAHLMAADEGQKLRAHGQWQPRRVRRYLRKIDALLELLLFLVHTTGGQPARGTEIATARHRNGFLQDRNVFVMDGQVVFVSRYHKTQSLWDKPRVIPRFLPWRVGQLIGIYLIYICELRTHLSREVLGSAQDDYIWAGINGPWETDRLTRVISRETGTRLKCRLTTLEYRHCAITIGRQFVGEQFGHGYQEQVGEGEVEEPEMEVDSGLELQAGRTEKIGVQTYGVPIDIVQHLSLRSIQFFRQLSDGWHRFLGLSSTWQHEEASRRQSSRSDCKRYAEASDGQEDPRKRPRPGGSDGRPVRLCHLPSIAVARDILAGKDDLTNSMRRVLGRNDVSFRSKEQEDALRAILANETPLVVVLPTGGGKSLLFMAPACLKDPGVTIVVVPFRALINDLKTRLVRADIEHLEWKHGEVNPAAVVVVSADIAGSWGFLTYASLLNQKGLLRRVVIDECHLTYTSSNYRPKLTQLKTIRTLSCPILLLTATQPPVLEHELGESMLVRGARYIRASTVRPNIRYLVQSCPGGKLLDTAVQICQRRRETLAGNKAVVYCRSREQCESVATALACHHYHAGVLLPDRTQRLEEWVTTGGYITATSALGTGVDYPGIVFVLHVGMPHGMIDFAQESGRAGRGGEMVDSLVLIEEGAEERIEELSRSVDESAMVAFVQTGGCRRVTMSTYLDGYAVSCSGGQLKACDRCGDGIAEWQEAQRREQEEQAKLRAALDEIADGCVACWISGAGEAEEEYMHTSADCTRPPGLGQDGYDDFRRGVRYGPDTHSCFKCGISQKFCLTGQGTELTCQWAQVLVPAVITVMGGGRAGFGIVQKVGFGGERGDWKGYRKWLGQRHKRRRWGAVMSNAMVVLIETVLYVTGE